MCSYRNLLFIYLFIYLLIYLPRSPTGDPIGRPSHQVKYDTHRETLHHTVGDGNSPQNIHNVKNARKMQKTANMFQYVAIFDTKEFLYSYSRGIICHSVSKGQSYALEAW